MSEPDPDAEWLDRVGRGEPQATRDWVAAKLPRLLALAQRLLGRRDEAEEVVQEVFMRAWKQVPNWRPGRARFDTWLHRVALNLCYDRLRERVQQEPYGNDHDGADSAPQPLERLDAAQRRDAVTVALAALPARQREALVLQYYQGLGNIEAAALMDVSVEALESLLSRARRTLRAQLQAHRKEGP